jgi:hypothetical protein
MGIEEDWFHEGNETLNLLSFYGLDGQTYEDSRIIDLLDDRTTTQVEPRRRLLQQLRQIDMDWKRDSRPFDILYHSRTDLIN